MLKHHYLAKWKKKMYMIEYYQKHPELFNVKKTSKKISKKHKEDLEYYRKWLERNPIQRRSRKFENILSTTTNTTESKIRPQKNIKQNIKTVVLTFD